MLSLFAGLVLLLLLGYGGFLVCGLGIQMPLWWFRKCTAVSPMAENEPIASIELEPTSASMIEVSIVDEVVSKPLKSRRQRLLWVATCHLVHLYGVLQNPRQCCGSLERALSIEAWFHDLFDSFDKNRWAW